MNLNVNKIKLTAKEKAIKRIKKVLVNTNDCIITNLPTNVDGYVHLQLRQFGDGKKYHFLGHRLAYELHYKETLTSDNIICHKCDIPSCINPLHLFKGTHKDNVMDKIRKKRQAKGNKNGRYKHGKYSKYPKDC